MRFIVTFAAGGASTTWRSHVRKIISSDEVLGGHGPLTTVATTERFHSKWPKFCAAVKATYEEANEFINNHKHEMKEIYLKVGDKQEGRKMDREYFVQ